MSKKQNLESIRIEVSIIIVSYNVKKYLLQCIESILIHTNTTFKYEIIVVDNNSRDNAKKELKEKYPLINYIKNQKNIGFSKAMNQAINESNGKYIFQLNPDTEIVENSILKMHNFLSSQNQLAILGPQDY